MSDPNAQPQGTPPAASSEADPLASAIPADGPAAHIAELEARNAELEAKQAELQDAFLRARAESENVRRRAEEETAKARKFALESFADALLPVRDSLEAALANGKVTAPDKLLEGVETTLRQLTSAFERNRVVEIAPPPGTKFDPHQHQAISAVPHEQEANTIVSVLQKGYLIADRVLRPALVLVSAPK
jgi:molecular chaperone GrpE